MKALKQQPKVLVLAIAVALGFTALGAGCAPGNDDNGTTPATTNANANGNMAAGTANSTKPVKDTWITGKVKASLATMEGVDNTDIDVETNNGVVTLTGRATSQASITAMAAAAKRVDGVTRVDTSGLMVAGEAGMNGMNGMDDDEHVQAGAGNSHHPVSDTWITTKVLAALQTVDGLDNSDIAVETNNGVVVLTGHLDSQDAVDAAVKEAKTIDGVKSVDTSRITVGGQ